MVQRRTAFVQEPGSSCLSVSITVHLVVKLDNDMVTLTRAFLGSEDFPSKPLRDRWPQVANRTRCTVNPLSQLSLIYFTRLLHKPQCVT